MVELRDDLRLALDRVSFAKALGIVPDPWQEDLLRSEASRVLMLCCRQSGKSTMSALIGLHRGLYHPGSLVLILAPSERQAKETFSKVSGFYRELHGTAPAESDRKLGMVLSNGSRIEALPGSEKTIRGFSGVDLLILDEGARISDELYHATRPMLAVSGGALIMLSTPWGKRGVFYEEWTNGDAEWLRILITADDVPRISEAFLAAERRALPVRIFAQEYRCEFVELDDAVFAFDEIEDALDDDVMPLFGGGDPSEAADDSSADDDITPLFGGAA